MRYYLDTEFLEGTQKKRLLGVPYGNTKNTIDLISIGIVSEDTDGISNNNREYYAISKEFNLKEAWNRYQEDVNLNYKPDFGDHNESPHNPKYIRTYWIRENVLKPIFIEFLKLDTKYLSKQRRIIGFAPPLNTEFSRRNFNRLLKRFGKTNKEIAKEILIFSSNGYFNEGNTGIPFEEMKKYELTGKHKPEFYAYYADYDWVVFCWLFGKMIDLPKGFPMYCRDLKQDLDNAINRETNTMYGMRDLRINPDTSKPKTHYSFDDRLSIIKKYPNYPKQENEHNALDDAKWNLKLYEFIKSL